MKLSKYAALISVLYNQQILSIENHGYCLDEQGNRHYYSSVDEYKKYVKDLILNSIANSTLIEDIPVNRVFKELNII